MPPSFVVSPLAAGPGCRHRRAGKSASGGLRGYNGPSVFEKRCGTREIALRGWEPRWGAALAQTATYQSKSGDVVASVLKGDFKGAFKNLMQAWGLAVKDPGWVTTAVVATAAPYIAGEEAAANGNSRAASSSLNGERLGMQLAAEEAAGVRMPTTIRSYSSHALDQIAGRDGGLGVKPAAVVDSFQNPSSIQYKPSKYGPTFSFAGSNATVIVNPQGRVVTAWATSSEGVLRP